MAARSTFHAAQLCPRGSVLSTVMNCGTRAPTKDTSRAPRHHLHVAQTFRATGTLYIGILSLCLDLNVRRGLPTYGKKPSPHRVSAEATGMPEGRTQCGDERTRGHNAPSAPVSTTCADSYQMITSLPADQRQTFSTARDYIKSAPSAASAPPGRVVRHNLGHPPSGYRPQKETRTRRRRMTAEFRLFPTCRTRDATCLAARGRDSRSAVYASGDLPQKTPRLSDAGRLHQIAAHRA